MKYPQKYCKFHFYFGHDIDFFKENYYKVETMLTLKMLEFEDVKMENMVGMISFQKE
jgi:hypothetical protein